MKPVLLALLAILVVVALRHREPDRAVMRATPSLAGERLKLARHALLATGYFTPAEVGPDVAPRITELWIALSRDADLQPSDPYPASFLP